MERKPLRKKLDFSRFEGLTGKEALEILTEDEREYFTERVREGMPPEAFDALTKNQLNNEILLYILLKECFSLLEHSVDDYNADDIKKEKNKD